MARLFLDANVFLYAIGADSPHRAPCREVLLAVGQGKLDGVTSSEVPQELPDLKWIDPAKALALTR